MNGILGIKTVSPFTIKIVVAITFPVILRTHGALEGSTEFYLNILWLKCHSVPYELADRFDSIHGYLGLFLIPIHKSTGSENGLM